MLTLVNLANNHTIISFSITNLYQMLSFNYKGTYGSVLDSTSSPSIGSLCIYLYPWYPLIINSWKTRTAIYLWGHLTSLNLPANMKKLHILSLGAVVYLNLYLYKHLIKLSSWNSKSLVLQCCFLCYFTKFVPSKVSAFHSTRHQVCLQPSLWFAWIILL